MRYASASRSVASSSSNLRCSAGGARVWDSDGALGEDKRRAEVWSNIGQPTSQSTYWKLCTSFTPHHALLVAFPSFESSISMTRRKVFDAKGISPAVYAVSANRRT